MKEFFGDFVEELGKKLGETVETATNKANEAVELSRLKGQIRTLEKANTSDLIDLGRIVLSQYQSGGTHTDEIDGICEAILSRKESIAEYTDKIAYMRGAKRCLSCSRLVQADMHYCPFCGNDMTQAGESFSEDTPNEEVKEASENISAPDDTAFENDLFEDENTK